MRAEKGFSNLVPVLVAALLLGSVAFIGVSPINLMAASQASDERAQNISPFISLEGDGDAEYLIITRPMFETALENLVGLKSLRMSVKVVTVEGIVGVGKVRIYPSDDAWVTSYDPNQNHGSEDTLNIGPDYNMDSYLKFSLSILPPGITISDAKLLLYCYSIDGGTTVDGIVHRVDNDSWSEGTITWNNRPAHGAWLDSVSVNVEEQWYSWDVTAWVQNEFGGDQVSSIYIYGGQASGPGERGLKRFYSIDCYDPETYGPYLEITTGYPGGDIPEQIRNCIRDHYENHGTQWVLLAGDADPDDVGNNNPTLDKDWEVPVKYVEYEYEENVPTDHYYADLDDDGAAEVYVGRFPGRTVAMIDNVVQKTVAYESNPSYRRQACFFSGVDYSFESYSKEIVDAYAEPSWLEIHEYYESEGTLDRTTFVNVVNAYDPIVINAMGHGYECGIGLGVAGSGGEYVWAGNVWNLTNTGFLIYAYACLTNKIDDDYCYGFEHSLGEWMLFGSADGGIGGSNGAVGYIGATRTLKGEPNEAARFFAELLGNHEYHQGAAFYKSNPSRVFMLLGDPELKIINPPHGAEVHITPNNQNGLPGEMLTYTVTVRNVGNFTDTYTLTVDDDAGWNPSISPTSLEIPVNENRTATLSITIPESVVDRVADNITVTATLTENAEIYTSAKCIAYAAREPTDDACVGTGRGKINLYVGVDEYGDLNRSFLKFSLGYLPEDVVIEKASLNLYCWSSYNSPQIEIRAVEDDSWSEESITWDDQPALGGVLGNNSIDTEGRWYSWDVTSFVNNQSAGDGVASFCLKSADEGANRMAIFYSKEQGHEYSPYLTVAFNHVEVSISPDYQSGPLGATLEYTVTVTNTGEGPDNFSLENTDTENWALVLSPTTLENVLLGENRTVMLSVTIPENAELGTEDEITVTATSWADPTVSDSTSCTATATSFSLDLVAGWNQVGFTGVGEGDTPNNMMPDVYTMRYWDAPYGPYRAPHGDQPVKDNLGYWVRVDQDDNVTVYGVRPENRTIYLVAGWNLVHFPLTNENTTPDNLFAGLTYTMRYWDAPGGPYRAPFPDQPVKVGVGYWVKLDQDVTVTVPL